MLESLCVICKGRGWCGKPCPILAKLKEFQPKIKEHFSGSSPPEIFVGRYGYPSVYTGILAPPESGDTTKYSMPEQWHAEKASILQILSYRATLIYSRFKSNIKERKNKLLGLMQELSLSSKPVSTEFWLKKKPSFKIQLDMHMPIISNPSLLVKAKLEENPYVERKVDYLTSDYDVKAGIAMEELYKAKIPISSIIKILSAGMIGLAIQRKLVPTRWSTTAIDSTISKQLIKKIRYYQEISEFQLFNANYLGNYYEILFLPSSFAFEVMEAKLPGSVWNPSGSTFFIAADYEGWHGRKSYASNTGGGYYAPRLAIVEYLGKIKRQASCLVMRECRKEYFVPCGVGILRECCREALQKKPEKFSSLKDTLQAAQKRLKLPIKVFTKKSKLLKEYKEQKKLSEF